MVRRFDLDDGVDDARIDTMSGRCRPDEVAILGGNHGRLEDRPRQRQCREDLLRVFDFVGLDFDDDALVAMNVAAASQLQDELVAVRSDGPHRHRSAGLKKNKLRPRGSRGRYQQKKCAEAEPPAHDLQL